MAMRVGQLLPLWPVESEEEERDDSQHQLDELLQLKRQNRLDLMIFKLEAKETLCWDVKLMKKGAWSSDVVGLTSDASTCPPETLRVELKQALYSGVRMFVVPLSQCNLPSSKVAAVLREVSKLLPPCSQILIKIPLLRQTEHPKWRMDFPMDSYQRWAEEIREMLQDVEGLGLCLDLSETRLRDLCSLSFQQLRAWWTESVAAFWIRPHPPALLTGEEEEEIILGCSGEDLKRFLGLWMLLPRARRPMLLLADSGFASSHQSGNHWMAKIQSLASPRLDVEKLEWLSESESFQSAVASPFGLTWTRPMYQRREAQEHRELLATAFRHEMVRRLLGRKNPERTVVVVLGAGLGLLVQDLMDICHDLHNLLHHPEEAFTLYAVEKFQFCYNELVMRKKKDPVKWALVELIREDPRVCHRHITQEVDVVVHTWVGGFGCNQLAPEMVSSWHKGLQLKSDARLLPAAFTALVAPIAARVLHSRIAATTPNIKRGDVLQCVYQVEPGASEFLAAPKPLFRFPDQYYQVLDAPMAKFVSGSAVFYSELTAHLSGFLGFVQIHYGKDLAGEPIVGSNIPDPSKTFLPHLQPLFFPLAGEPIIVRNGDRVCVDFTRASVSFEKEAERMHYEWTARVSFREETPYGSVRDIPYFRKFVSDPERHNGEGFAWSQPVPPVPEEDKPESD